MSVEQIPYPAYQTKLQEEFASGAVPTSSGSTRRGCRPGSKTASWSTWPLTSRRPASTCKQYIPSLVALHAYKGAIYGFPKDWDTIAIYYNENYMQAHHLTFATNWTWNPTNGGTFLKFLEEATTDTSGNNATVAQLQRQQGRHVRHEPCNNSLPERLRQLLADGRLPHHPRGLGLVGSFNTAACVQTTQFIRDLMYKYHVVVPGSELGANGDNPSGEDRDLFAAGKIAMYLEGDWNTDPGRGRRSAPSSRSASCHCPSALTGAGACSTA